MAGLFDYFSGGGQGVLPSEDYPAAPTVPQRQGGFMGALNEGLNSPLTMFGLGLAGGATPQQGFQHAAQNMLAQQKMNRDNTPALVREYQYAVSTGQFKGTYMDFLQTKNATDNRFGNNPQPYLYTDENGDQKIGLAQPGTSGKVNDMPAPRGGAWTVPGVKIDTGTGTILAPNRVTPGGSDPQGAPQSAPVMPAWTNSIPGGVPSPGIPSPGEAPPALQNPTAAPGGGTYYPKDVQGVAREKTVGKGVGEAQLSLPGVESNGEQMLAELDALEKHPGMSSAVGFWAGKSPMALGENASDFIKRTDQIQAGAWSQGIKVMKTFGSLSNAEGSKIDAMVSRLGGKGREVNEKDYKQAIKELKQTIRIGIENARNIAAGKMQPYRNKWNTKEEPSDSGAVRKYNPETGKIE